MKPPLLHISATDPWIKPIAEPTLREMMHTLQQGAADSDQILDCALEAVQALLEAQLKLHANPIIEISSHFPAPINWRIIKSRIDPYSPSPADHHDLMTRLSDCDFFWGAVYDNQLVFLTATIPHLTQKAVFFSNEERTALASVLMEVDAEQNSLDEVESEDESSAAPDIECQKICPICFAITIMYKDGLPVQCLSVTEYAALFPSSP